MIVSNESSVRIAFAGILLLVGHGFPIWLRFIGGKGLSPVGGFTAALLPYSALIAIAVSGLAWLKTRKFMPRAGLKTLGLSHYRESGVRSTLLLPPKRK